MENLEDIVSQFLDITGSNDIEEARSIIIASNYSLEQAMEIYFASRNANQMDQEIPTSYQSQNLNFNRIEYEDQVRRPDRVKRQRLSDDYDVLAGSHVFFIPTNLQWLYRVNFSEKRTKIVKTEQSFSSAKTYSNKTQGLSNLYRAPIDLITSGTFDEVSFVSSYTLSNRPFSKINTEYNIIGDRDSKGQ
jgi:hypothetical protein